MSWPMHVNSMNLVYCNNNNFTVTLWYSHKKNLFYSYIYFYSNKNLSYKNYISDKSSLEVLGFVVFKN